MIKNKIFNRLLILIVVSIIFIPKLTQAAEGDVWILPTDQNVETGEHFDIEVHMDTGGKNVGAFNMVFDFTSAEVTVDTAQGDDGLDKGASASSYVVMPNATDIGNGHYSFAGIATSGHANGTNVHLVTIHCQATTGFTAGTSNLDLRVNELSNELGTALASGTATGAIVTYQSGDTQSPILTEVTPVTTPTSDSTPDYTFSSNEAGTISYGGSCSSSTTVATTGNNTITFNTLANGTYNDCTVTVTDATSNASTPLPVSAFIVDATAPNIAITAPTKDNNDNGTAITDTTIQIIDTIGITTNNITIDGTTTVATSSFDCVQTNDTQVDCTISIDSSGDLTIAAVDDAGNNDTQTETGYTVTGDAVSPILTEVTPVATPTSDSTPDYTFSSNEAGTISYGGSCSSSTTVATTGNNTITFNTLANGTYNDCTVTVTDATSNASTPLPVSAFIVDVTAGDDTPPVRSDGTPQGTLSHDTTNIMMTLDTNENANCKYDTTSNTSFSTMTYMFTTSGTKKHSKSLSGLTSGNSYTYYVRCQDTSVNTNTNTDDYVISFAIDEDEDDVDKEIISEIDVKFDVKFNGKKKGFVLKSSKKAYVKDKKVKFKGNTAELIGGKVIISVKGEGENEAIISADGSWAQNVKFKHNKTYKVKLKFYDALGNKINTEKYKVRIDEKDPEFTNLPPNNVVHKRPGDIVWWDATDDKRVKRFKVYFNGIKEKITPPRHFKKDSVRGEYHIPDNTSPGKYIMEIRAYDKAGNKERVYIEVNVL